MGHGITSDSGRDLSQWRLFPRDTLAVKRHTQAGIADRGGVIDLVNKLEKQCQKMPFHLLLLSPQASDEFLDLTYVLHYNLEFNPDRMYEDLGHWMYCTEVMQGILESLEVSSKNLFWCPPKPPIPKT